MNANTHGTQESARTELRKTQVLDAATTCFRLHGFHNTSIMQISKAAGMSVGHIYHYFENKEAIISAIVDRELLNLLTIVARIRDGSAGRDLLCSIMDEAQLIVHETRTDPNAALMLEIVAEAARNPSVAGMVQAADQEALEHFRKLIQDGLRFRGIDFQDKDLEGPLEVFYALCEGLSIRAIRNPEMNSAAVVAALRHTLEFILEELIAKTKYPAQP